MNSISSLSVSQLKRAIAIKLRLQSLEEKLGRLLGGVSAPGTGRGRAKSTPRAKGRRRMSPKARAKMAATARKRWAKAKAAGKNSL
jgi:hypothetical protein